MNTKSTAAEEIRQELRNEIAEIRRYSRRLEWLSRNSLLLHSDDLAHTARRLAMAADATEKERA